MSDSLESFRSSIDHVAATVAEYARQIDTGVYGRRMFDVFDDDQDSDDYGDCLGTFVADDEDDAYTAYVQSAGFFLPRNLVAIEESDDGSCLDVPTIVDDDGNHESIEDWPLEVVVKIGRPLAVVIGTGGPHIEIVQDLEDGSAKLAAYWAGHREFRHGPEFQTVLDYLTSWGLDEAPDEYK